MLVQAVIKSAEHYTLSERESYGENRTITCAGFSIRLIDHPTHQSAGTQVIGIVIGNEKWVTQKCLSLVWRTRWR